MRPPTTLTKHFTALAAALGTLAVFAGPAAAAQVRYVARGGTAVACAEASAANPFGSIADALRCAASTDQVRVGPGHFDGQVSINTSVTLRGSGGQTVISPPAGGSFSVPNITVGAGRKVTISDLTLDGVDQSTPGIVATSGALSVVNARITRHGDHSVIAGGGAISVLANTGVASVSVAGSTIDHNRSDFGGGGIFVGGGSQAASLTVRDSTITANSTDGGQGNGGGIAVGTASLSVRKSTITSNTAFRGGGIFGGQRPQGIVVADTILAGNNASADGPDCFASGVRPVSSGGHNLLGRNTGVAGTGCPGFADGIDGDQVGSAAQPLDPVLAQLADNGGPTPTAALLLGSPAINTGGTADCQAAPGSDHDQRGLPRKSATRFACDIGAYDTQGTPLQTLYVSRIAKSDPSCADASASRPFTAVAGALECARNGATIKLGAGRFAGQFSIDANVILLGGGMSSVIARPAGGDFTVPNVAIASGRTVTLKNLTVDGVDQTSPGVSAADGSLSVVRSRITNNGNHVGDGGGIAVFAGAREAHLTVFASTIDHNFSDFAGGGISVGAASRPGTAAVLNSTVTANTSASGSGRGGGGIAVGASTLDVRSSTIAGNTGPLGGGLWAASAPGEVTLTDTILAANSAASGPDCVSRIGRPVISGGHNLIGQTTGVSATGCPGFTDGANGDQVGTPAQAINPLLAPLAANGGLTPTLALLTGSPALAAGDPVACQAAPIGGRDQRDAARNATARGTCDIGAYDTGV
jgi:hypothetical protein